MNIKGEDYEIGVELVESGFEYFAGGGLKKVNGADNEQKNLYEMAEEAGYKVVYTQQEAEEIVHTIVGSFGLVTVAPLTALTSGLLLTATAGSREETS